MKKYLSLLLLLFLNFLSAQDNINQKIALESFMANNIDSCKAFIDKITNNETKKALIWHMNAFLNGVKNDSLVNDSLYEKNNYAFVLNKIKNNEIYKFHYYQKDSLIFENLKQALNFSKKNNDTTLIRFTYNKLLKHLFNNAELFDLLNKYNEDFKFYVKTFQDEALYTYYKYTSKAYQTNTPYIDKYKEVLKKLESSDDYITKGILNQIIGISETYFNKNHEKAIKYLTEAIKNYEKVDNYTSSIYLYKTNNNLGYIYNNINKPKLALEYYKKASEYDLGNYNLLSKSKLYLSLSLVYENLNQLDSALFYIKKEKEILKKFNEFENAIKQSEIETKYQTAEKEKENLQLKASNLEIEAKRKQNRNLLFGALGLLFFGTITFLLIQKNTKRKQLLAIQEKELASQKVTTLLKEQELTAIDAMIEGQEKERQRIANDLHDDLGGLMATLKLHFNALKDKQSPELYKKTTELLDEAYNKVRTVAHTKNSGVMAKKGLLKALNDMAKTVTASNQLQVDIFDHGLNERLENSLELTIFRIVQELITNVIKHAEATEASIHITKHKESLNIMVEDNGKGFNTKNITKKSGMGIHSIDKRIENLGGSVTIESEINKGTTVIIDIPS